MKTLLKGGYVVSADGVKKSDVLINGEIIERVEPDIICNDAEITDVSEKLLFPGFIDAHTHFDLEVANTVTADDFYTGSKAAIKGGTTTIIDFATQNKGETLLEALKNWHKKADGKTSCDYGFHMAISDWNKNVSDELPLMFENGISSFKLYMTYPAMMLNDREIYEVLKRLKELSGIAGVHCENAGVIDALIAEKKAQGENSVSCHYKTRPAILEAEAISRLLKIAQTAQSDIIIVHLSSKLGFDEVLHARKTMKNRIYLETCPQYLTMTDSLYNLEGFEGARYVCAPPLRKQEDINTLWNCLKNGDIDTISTDHCSFTLKQKEMGISDFTKIPGGIPGVETRGVLIYTCGVASGKITPEQMCGYLSENPAKLYGLYPKKGCIKAGSDADITVYDTKNDSVITAKNQFQNTDYAPFEGFKTKGSVASVYLRGRKVFDGKTVVEKTGQYLKRGKYNL